MLSPEGSGRRIQYYLVFMVIAMVVVTMVVFAAAGPVTTVAVVMRMVIRAVVAPILRVRRIVITGTPHAQQPSGNHGSDEEALHFPSTAGACRELYRFVAGNTNRMGLRIRRNCKEPWGSVLSFKPAGLQRVLHTPLKRLANPPLCSFIRSAS